MAWRSELSLPVWHPVRQSRVERKDPTRAWWLRRERSSAWFHMKQRYGEPVDTTPGAVLAGLGIGVDLCLADRCRRSAALHPSVLTGT